VHCVLTFRNLQQADAAPKRAAKPAAATAAASTAAGTKEPKKKATRGRSKLITPEVVTALLVAEVTVDTTTATTKKRKAATSTTTAASAADTSSYDLGDISSGDELPLPSSKKRAVAAVATAGESGVVEVKLVKRRSQKGAASGSKQDAAFSVQELVQAQAAREAIGTGAGSGWD
jgi:hypothetical protein